MVADQTDADLDGDGNVCDADDNNDGVDDAADNCPLAANPSQRDTDGDGIDDTADDGASTPAGELSDAVGCTIAQLCPCGGARGTSNSWKNHGKYLSCVAHAANDFRDAGLISPTERGDIVSAAAGSDCGRR